MTAVVQWRSCHHLTARKHELPSTLTDAVVLGPSGDTQALERAKRHVGPAPAARRLLNHRRRLYVMDSEHAAEDI